MYALVDVRTGQPIDRASTQSELEAAKHSQHARTGRPLDDFKVMDVRDLNAFRAADAEPDAA